MSFAVWNMVSWRRYCLGFKISNLRHLSAKIRKQHITYSTGRLWGSFTGADSRPQDAKIKNVYELAFDLNSLVTEFNEHNARTIVYT